MWIDPYLIPDKLTNIDEGGKKDRHTWLGTNLPNKNILLVLTTTSYHEEYAEQFVKWFDKDDGKTVYVKPDRCFIMPRHVFDKYYKTKKEVCTNRDKDCSNYITRHASDDYHIRDLSKEQWKQIFDNAASQAQVYDYSIAKHVSPAKIFVIVFIIIAIIALALGLGLGLGLK